MTAVEVDVKTTNVTTLEDGDHDKFAHVVIPSSAVTQAYITGSEVRALCGKVWVPTRAPELFEVCPECKELLEVAKAHWADDA